MLIHTDEDETIEVDPGQVEIEDEDPYLSQDEVDSIVSKRLSRQERQLKEELKSDDEFFQTAAQERGIELREDGRPKGSTNKDEVKELRQRISELEPKAQKAEDLEEQIASARETRLENQPLQHADSVKDDLQDVFLSAAKSRFKYDNEEEAHVPVDEEGNVMFDGGEPAGPETVISEMEENRPSFFKDKSASSGPSDEPTSSSTGGKKVWTETEHASANPAEMDDETYQDWLTASDEDRIQE
ncbi:hypothetical protein [Salinibacter ruber]|uniref:hypothetical protein n=1 Tax=Salinibacter ruber TaxID=146919 RepID=UPI002072CF6E|nr:hypothetical protein [Salinibacter ruber]